MHWRWLDRTRWLLIRVQVGDLPHSGVRLVGKIPQLRGNRTVNDAVGGRGRGRRVVVGSRPGSLTGCGLIGRSPLRDALRSRRGRYAQFLDSVSTRLTTASNSGVSILMSTAATRTADRATSQAPGGGFTRSSAVWILLGLLLGGINAAPAYALQDPSDEPAANPPTESTPAAGDAVAPNEPPDNPLRTQRRMVSFFRGSVAAGRLDEAARCLNFSNVDPEKVAEDRDEYVRALEQIIDRLIQAQLLDTDVDLSDEPDAAPISILELIALERVEVTYDWQPVPQVPAAPAPSSDAATTPNDAGGVQGAPTTPSTSSTAASVPTLKIWRFSARTVADALRQVERIDAVIAASEPSEAPEANDPAPTAPGEEPSFDPLRSPYSAYQHFYLNAEEARSDPEAYQRAFEAMDFSQVAELSDQTRARYVDWLFDILVDMQQRPVALGTPRPEDLPQAAEADANEYNLRSADQQLSVTLLRRDGRFRFGPLTIERIPSMWNLVEAYRAPKRDTSSARALVNHFLSAMDEGDVTTAATCLDLTRLSQERAERRGPLLAGKLWMTLNRYRVIRVESLSDDPAGPPVTLLVDLAGRIEVSKVTQGERAGEWLFSASTVASIERLYEVYEKEPIVPELVDRIQLSFFALPSLYFREQIVPNAFKDQFWGLQFWQWCGLLVTVLVGILLRMLLRVVLTPTIFKLTQFQGVAMLPVAIRRGVLPSATFVMLWVWLAGLLLLDFGTVAQHGRVGSASVAGVTFSFQLALILYGIFAAYRLNDLLMGYLESRASQSRSKLDDVLMPLLHKLLQVVIFAIGGVWLAELFGFDVTPLLAGLGIGGLAFSFAAKDTIANFFGSVNVVLDKPFQKGEWVRIGDVEGVVEHVGLRSSRIRTFYKSQVTIPNGEIMNAKVDNMGRRPLRRIKSMISVTYSTNPEALEAFVAGIRELLRNHPYMNQDGNYVYVNQFGPSSIDILLYCFVDVPDWDVELRERQRLFLDIMRLARALKIEFAFPTQTVHLFQEQADDHAGADLPQLQSQAHDVGRSRAKTVLESNPVAPDELPRH